MPLLLKSGFYHDYVDHGKVVYAKSATIPGKLRMVHLNGIDGCWGRLKTRPIYTSQPGLLSFTYIQCVDRLLVFSVVNSL